MPLQFAAQLAELSRLFQAQQDLQTQFRGLALSLQPGCAKGVPHEFIVNDNIGTNRQKFRRRASWMLRGSCMAVI